MGQLSIGIDSKVAIPALGAVDTVPTSPSWQVTSKMRCLGHTLSSNGSIDVDFDDTVRRIWGCFYGNMCRGLRKASPLARLRFLASCVRTIASFRWTRWPFQASCARRLDGIQTSMIMQLFPFQVRPHEDALGFHLRRAQLCGRSASTLGRWSTAWQRHTVSWHEHVERAHDVKAWNHKIYRWRAKAWLQEQRFKHGRGVATNRTCTRAKQGRPATRWFEGYDQALNSGWKRPQTGETLWMVLRQC